MSAAVAPADCLACILQRRFEREPPDRAAFAFAMCVGISEGLLLTMSAFANAERRLAMQHDPSLLVLAFSLCDRHQALVSDFLDRRIADMQRLMSDAATAPTTPTTEPGQS